MLTATTPDGRPVFRGRVPDGAATPSPTANAPADGASGTAPPTPPAAPASRSTRRQVRSSCASWWKGRRARSSIRRRRTLTVPDYARTQASIGTPRVYRVRTARDLLLLKKDLEAVADTRSRLQPGRADLRAVRRVRAGGSAPAVTAKLLNRGGQPMADVPVQAAAGQPFMIDFPLASSRGGRVPAADRRQDRLRNRAGDDRVQGRQLTPRSLRRTCRASSSPSRRG